MGGGAAIRSAARVAGASLVNRKARGGFKVLPSAEHKVRSHPASVTLSSQGSKGSSIDATEQIQRPASELDDWDFLCSDDELLMGSLIDPEPKPRVVFGGAPTVVEAKEATSELKEALEKVYFSSPNSLGSKDSIEAGQVSVPLLTNSQYAENESSIIRDTRLDFVPKHAVQAFQMLSENPAAQEVVASLASDPNVWNAVIQNEALVDFIQSQKSGSESRGLTSDKHLEELSDASSYISDNASETASSAGSGFEDFLQNMKDSIFCTQKKMKDGIVEMKDSVVEMVNNVSLYLQKIFSSPGEENKSVDGDENSVFVEKTIMASLVGLATMVIMVVLVKRP